MHEYGTMDRKQGVCGTYLDIKCLFVEKSLSISRIMLNLVSAIYTKEGCSQVIYQTKLINLIII